MIAQSAAERGVGSPCRSGLTQSDLSRDGLAQSAGDQKDFVLANLGKRGLEAQVDGRVELRLDRNGFARSAMVQEDLGLSNQEASDLDRRELDRAERDQMGLDRIGLERGAVDQNVLAAESFVGSAISIRTASTSTARVSRTLLIDLNLSLIHI